MPADDYAWLANTHWYVPPETLLALRVVNGKTAIVSRLVDQTVWRFEQCFDGYVTGIAATNVGQGWSYNLIAGSVAPGGAVKLSFSTLGEGSSSPPIIGDGTLTGVGHDAVFLMQMTSGTTSMNVSHWSYMRSVRPSDPAWRSLPGYPGTSVPELTGLQTPIHIA